jgi:hypothetical protein
MYVHRGQGVVTEKTERFEMRVSTEFLKAVDQWRRQQPDQPSRAAAIRQLVEIELKQFGNNLGPVKKRRRQPLTD